MAGYLHFILIEYRPSGQKRAQVTKHWTHSLGIRVLTGLTIALLFVCPSAPADPAVNASAAATAPPPNSMLWQIARNKAAHGDPSMLNALQAQQIANQKAATQNAQTANSVRLGDGSIAGSLTAAPTSPPLFQTPKPSGGTAGNGQIVDPFELRQAYVDGLSFPNNRVVPSEQLGTASDTSTTTEPPENARAVSPPPPPSFSAAPPPLGPRERVLAAVPRSTFSPPPVSRWSLATPSPRSEVASMRLLASVGTSYGEAPPGRLQAPRDAYRTTWASRAMPSPALVSYLKYRHGLVIGSTDSARQRISEPGGGSNLPEDFVAPSRRSRYAGAAHNSTLVSAQDSAPADKWSSAIPTEAPKPQAPILPPTYGLAAPAHTGGGGVTGAGGTSGGGATRIGL